MSIYGKLIVSICLITGFTVPGLSQSGILQGKVTDKVTRETLIGANIRLEETGAGNVTDIDGAFRIEGIRPGTYTVIVSYVGYEPLRRSGIVINDGARTTMDFELGSNLQELKTAEVVSTRITHTENAVLAEMRKSEQVVNGISNQQISRTQDRNTSEVIRRLPGISIVEDRLVVIRGLSERYNNVMLNDAFAPSVESDKKAFSFDLLPSAMLDRVLVYKTASPELPGEFAGGVVKIYTRNLPEQDFISFGSSIGVRSNTTFRSFEKASTGRLDWLGMDNGDRSLPTGFPTNLAGLSAAEQAAWGAKLPNTWVSENITAPIDQRYQLAMAKRFQIGKVQAGNITGLQYSNTNETREATNINYNQFDALNGISDTIYSFEDRSYTQRVAIGLVSNFSFIISPKHKLEFKNLYQQNGANNTTTRTGSNIEEGNEVRNYAFRYNERRFYSGQLSGNHQLGSESTQFHWTAGLSTTRANEPDYRRIRTFRSLVDDDPAFYTQINSTASQADAGRFFSVLNEDALLFAGGFEHELKANKNNKKAKIKTGVLLESKKRDFEARWLSYTKSRTDRFDNSLLILPLNEVFSPQNFNDSTGFKLDEGTNGTDRYTATNDLQAFYASVSWPIGLRSTLSGGLRFEMNRLELQSADNNNNPLIVDNPINSLLPSISWNYAMNDNTVIRLAYGRTVNRPEFRELAPFAYYDFVFNNVMFGNPSLQTPRIDNFDLRYELYPAIGELISFGLFYKHFTQPIEQYFKPGAGSGGTRNFEYRNAESARSAGVEIEMRKSMNTLFTTGFLSKTAIGLNAAYISSKVDLGTAAVGQDAERIMMGQSPYLINGGLYYTEQEKQLQFNILYNIIGSRLFAVGTQGTPSVYELPRHVVDLSITKGIGKHLEVKAGVQDLLNQAVTMRQDSDENGSITSKDELVYQFKRGSYYTLGITVRY